MVDIKSERWSYSGATEVDKSCVFVRKCPETQTYSELSGIPWGQNNPGPREITNIKSTMGGMPTSGERWSLKELVD